MAIKSCEGSTGDWAFAPYYEISLMRIPEKSDIEFMNVSLNFQIYILTFFKVTKLYKWI